MNCSQSQIKNFFAALCYANKHTGEFEKQLMDVSERDLPNVLLASVILENCGLARIKEYIPEAARSPGPFWVPVPNQYILRDRAWLYPVIRACDPDRRTFTDLDYGGRIVEKIRESLSVPIKNQEKEVVVELKHCLLMISYVMAHPGLVGMSQLEMDQVMQAALSEEIFLVMKQQQVDCSPALTIAPIGTDDLSRGLKALGFMIALFVSSCLVIGYCCMDRKTV